MINNHKELLMTKKKLTSIMKKSIIDQAFLIKYDVKTVWNFNEDIANEDIIQGLHKFIGDSDRTVIKFMQSIPTFTYARYLEYLKYRIENKYDSVSEKFHILKFGNKLGMIKFKEREIQKTPSLKLWIEKYGKEDGTNRWNVFCERNKDNISLSRMIEKYGITEGKIKYEKTQYKLKNKNTLEYYINRFGEIEGTNKYKDRNKKNSNTSKKSYSDGNYRVDNTSLERQIEKYGEIEGKHRYKSICIKLSIKSKKMWQNDAYKTKHKISMSIAQYKIRQTMENINRWIPLDRKSDFDLYSMIIRRNTIKLNKSSLKNYHKLGSRINNAYELDHKISIYDGFLNNIPTHLMYCLDNLQCIHWKENSRKGTASYSILHEADIYKKEKYEDCR